MARPFATIFVVIAALLISAPAEAQVISSSLAGQSAAANARYGWSVRDAGDLNRDGIPDLVLGAPLDSRSGISKGRAYIFFG